MKQPIADMSLPPTQKVEEKKRLGLFLESWQLTAGRDTVKIYNWTRATKMWRGKSLRAPFLRGAFLGGGLRLDAIHWTSMLEPGKKFKFRVYFLTCISSLSLSTWHSRLIFHTLFLSPGGYLQALVVNKPLGR